METSNAKRPRVPREQCITNILPVEVLGHLFVMFLGPGHYRYVAGTCRAFAEAYGKVMNDHNGRKTTWESAAASVPCARLCLNEAESVVSIALPAAQNGQIDVIDFLYRNDFYWYWDSQLYSKAAMFGHVKVLEYGMKYRYSQPWKDSEVANSAAKSGQVDVLEWMRQHKAEKFVFCGCAQQAAGCGKVAVLDWLQRQGIPFQDVESCFCNAANNGHYYVMQWLLNHGFRLSRTLMDSAVRFGHIKLMKIALKRGGEMNTKTCAIAAFYGRLNALQWLRSHGCQWDGNVLLWAEENNSTDELLDWARSNGCPSDCDVMYSFMDLCHVHE
jgi:hypothetical protein